ncbi:alpha/beta-hydrolase [Aspergillus steynii IBT 23096]|uniref:Alpha/beta-hydrolase n=1 Tax=Aspergillus steynii IBT 23096 TaxID=1392250 RepID=A0A2I2G8J6_9EURO|nr:alpha/beta-hydrolase [Aspergillus steynii IBT 23096]PLB49163.1 alpha/beta-hydrolase [Aspergillus steynii IBT 23096]
MALPFSQVPSGAKIPPSPFQVHVPDEQIEELQLLIKLSKIAPPTFESQQQDRKYGITTEWLTTAREAWKTFDWRAVEDHLNGFPQFKYSIDGLDIHLVALFSENPDAIPILLLHGWPGNFTEFLPLLSLVKEKYTPATLPYHFIVPSLPGYTFSSGPPVDRDFGTEDIAKVMNQVMANLGFESYVVQAGDIGSKVARILGVDYDACRAVHLNACFVEKPASVADSALSESEARNLQRAQWFALWGSGYFVEQGTRTSTIGNAIATNPVALLAWIGEKFLDWVDDRDPLPLESILKSATLYWLTGTLPRSIYTYREAFPPPPIKHAMDPRWYIQKPFGYSYFPRELIPAPKAWVATTGNLVFCNYHEKGGHFAALERPRDLLDDVLAFVEQVRGDL